MKILLAIDDSKFSEAVLQAVVRQYRPQDREVKVLHVMEQVERLGYPAGVSEDQVIQAQELVNRAGQTLRSAGFKVDTTVYRGEARAGIIDSAVECHADLIVLGSHGRSGLERFLLGSIPDAILHHAPCSVEIVRLHSKQ
ncbi:MAG: universal stress protein [Acidobacteriia bacterium]|nr:universal stress protein [Terriglobia bacterium]